MDEPDLKDRDAEALGELLSAHPAASGMHKVNIAIASVFTFLPGAAALLFLFMHLTGDPKSQMWIGAAAFGAIALLPGIGLLFLLRKLRWKLFLYQNGFVFARGRNKVVPWGAVKSMFEEQDVVAGIRADARLKFTFPDGGWLIIDSAYKRFAEFSAAVRAGVTRAVVARASAALKKGEAFAFGKLKITRTGLAHGDDELTWAEVGEVAIEDYGGGYAIRIYAKGKSPLAKGRGEPWFSRAVTEFPNYPAFLELAGKVTRVALTPPPAPPRGRNRPPAG